MDELEKLQKHWQDDDFQRKHALAREIVVNRLRELNREYEEKTGLQKSCNARIMTWILIPQLLH